MITEALDACGREPVGDIATDTFLPDFLDSVVLSSLLVMIEDDWDIEIADEEIEPERFETVGSLAAFVATKLTSQ